MDIVVFGSTGRVGRLLVAGALARDHTVTAFAGDPAAGRGDGRLRVVAGDVLDAEAVSAAVAVQEAALFAFDPADSRRAGSVIAGGMLNVVRAMKRHGVRRLVCLSAGGIGPGREGSVTWFYDHFTKPLFLKSAFADLRHMEVTVRQSGLDWTIVRPPRLTDGGASGRYRTGPGYTLAGGKAIDRADLARFMLDQLETDENRGHAVAIAY